MASLMECNSLIFASKLRLSPADSLGFSASFSLFHSLCRTGATALYLSSGPSYIFVSTTSSPMYFFLQESTVLIIGSGLYPAF